ncbi:MAG: RNA polymerase sigma factor (sigma-70 family) [Verrucomicrobiales bacterium]|jgi:RNA polymerase sigma factor (sigma-70 family)
MPPIENKRFEETRWSLISRAGSDDARAAEALEELCRHYWFPIYAFARRSGHTPEDAEDLTQDFFAKFFVGRDFRRAAEVAGKFRSYVLRAMKNHLISAHHRSQAKRRGGDAIVIPLDQADAESRLLGNLAGSGASLDHQFDHEWALAVVETVIVKLRDEYDRLGKEHVFDRLQEAIEGPPSNAFYEEAAKALGLNKSSTRVATHRLRLRYRALLQKEVADMLHEPTEAQVTGEIRHLFEALMSA